MRQVPCPIGYISRRDVDNKYAQLVYDGRTVGSSHALDFLAREDLSEELAMTMKEREKTDMQRAKKCCLTVLEARCPNPTCQQGHAPSETQEERLFLTSSRFCYSRCSLANGSITPVSDPFSLHSPCASSHHLSSVRVCVWTFPCL